MLRILQVSIFFISLVAFGQQPFAVHVVPTTMHAVPAIHSGAFAVNNGKWFFIGGRRDGIHNVQTMQAFPAYNRNDSIYMVNPANDTYQAVSAQSLPLQLYGAICSSNMEFYQDGSMLYMIGGYGWVDSISTWRTWPSLASVDLNCLENAISNQLSFSSCFSQLIDTNMAVAGGGLEKIDSTFYLVFGHRFDGFYNKMNSGFTQVYTEQVRTFTINTNTGLAIGNYSAITDTGNFHRRDLNVSQQVFPDRSKGITAFGGVFQKHVNLPFLTPVDIHAGSYQHQAAFNQNLVQYTSAILSVYDSTNNYMHSVFFGGISLYTLDTTSMTLVQDTLVPFVNTISKVTRDPFGNLVESKLPESMPSLKGTNAFFIQDWRSSSYNDRVVDLNSISGNQRVGFIVGGILADQPNVVDLDPVGMSRPNAIVYEVYIDRTVDNMDEIRLVNDINNVRVFPNPARNYVSIDFTLNASNMCEVKIFNNKGQVVKTVIENEKLTGDQHFSIPLNGMHPGAYVCRIRSGATVKSIRFIVTGF